MFKINLWNNSAVWHMVQVLKQATGNHYGTVNKSYEKIIRINNKHVIRKKKIINYSTVLQQQVRSYY